MSNSSLVVYTKISPNKTVNRNHVIDTITIHCMAGNLTIESCGNLFADSTRGASSNYGIGSDGRIGMYVEEKDRSWCSSSGSNDHRAVTIEVANDGGESTGWHVSDKAYNALIDLVTDICRRNGIKQLLWRGDKSLIGQVDKQNMTVHRWFAAKACPGDYLYNLHGQIANQVNARLGAPAVPDNNNNDSGASYLVRVTADVLNIRKGPGTSYGIAGTIQDRGIYTIVQTEGNWGKLKSGAGWICLDYTVRV
ncbi:N-acetylmuramoyl-L-alanine amidase [[Clostridium] polysaccharolyticum]|uniref:N-acetylmuramoyl-L-alanine amidase n=1 Tax=[Clostridium] polysaccharolyticum TaxID=29364 RepID=A0A1I0CZY4_9FIRM|nr:N-acetylmuramoyl-L-alanine amidase [[Clostridium] polysaccharolyticum]SET24908.1 N-acetylmuramoyl-L-alanine amidase [[Clostridium] polysaccharolyticum]